MNLSKLLNLTLMIGVGTAIYHTWSWTGIAIWLAGSLIASILLIRERAKEEELRLEETLKKIKNDLNAAINAEKPK